MLNTKYIDIVRVDDIATEKFRHPSDVINMALLEKARPVTADEKQILLIGIDYQNDFVLPDKSKVTDGEPYGSLSVPGSKGDIERCTRFIYDNLGKISRIMLSMDTHYPNQIFHRMMWRDQNGMPVQPYTLITPEDLLSGKFQFMKSDPEKVLDCARSLVKAGKGGIFIWPDHCLAGSPGWNLETQLMQMVSFHSAVRNVDPIIALKGTDRYSEMYGYLEPEYNPNGLINKTVLDTLGDFDPVTGELLTVKWDMIIIAGEAASHCVPESTMQTMKQFEGHPEIIQRMYILEDCTSPVPGFEQQMNDAFNEFRRRGVNIVKSTDLTL